MNKAIVDSLGMGIWEQDYQIGVRQQCSVKDLVVLYWNIRAIEGVTACICLLPTWRCDVCTKKVGDEDRPDQSGPGLRSMLVS